MATMDVKEVLEKLARVRAALEKDKEEMAAVVKEQLNAPLLLGQTAIEKLGKITIDGCKLIIHK